MHCPFQGQTLLRGGCTSLATVRVPEHCVSCSADSALSAVAAGDGAGVGGCGECTECFWEGTHAPKSTKGGIGPVYRGEEWDIPGSQDGLTLKSSSDLGVL